MKKGSNVFEFKSKLEETAESKATKNLQRFGSYEDHGFRLMKSVSLSKGVSLSIQASYGHYCTPRQTLPVEDYTDMELAIFLDDQWSSIEEVSSNQDLIARLNGYSDGGVYGYVPVELIEELYQELI